MLLRARLSAESRSQCNKSYTPAITVAGSKIPDGILDSQLCAGSTSGKDSCQVRSRAVKAVALPPLPVPSSAALAGLWSIVAG